MMRSDSRLCHERSISHVRFILTFHSDKVIICACRPNRTRSRSSAASVILYGGGLAWLVYAHGLECKPLRIVNSHAWIALLV